MKTVLVTGANGYIGKHVVKYLLSKDVRLLVSDVGDFVPPTGAHKISVDLFCGSESIYEEMGCPDVCIHLAWKDGFAHNSHAHMGLLSQHYQFISNMLQGGLPQLSVMGSMHEIGYHEGSIDETTPCQPLSMYGVAKDALRRSALLLASHHGTVLQWLRAYYIYGDDKRGQSIFAKIIKAEQQGQKKFPFTTGKNLYDFIHVEELARMISEASLQTEETGIINCCTGRPESLASRVEAYIAEHGLSITLDYGAYPDRPYDSPGVWGDATRIHRILESIER